VTDIETRMSRMLEGLGMSDEPTCPHLTARRAGRGEDGGIVIEAWTCVDCGIIVLDRERPTILFEAGRPSNEAG